MFPCPARGEGSAPDYSSSRAFSSRSCVGVCSPLSPRLDPSFHRIKAHTVRCAHLRHPVLAAFCTIQPFGLGSDERSRYTTISQQNVNSALTIIVAPANAISFSVPLSLSDLRPALRPELSILQLLSLRSQQPFIRRLSLPGLVRWPLLRPDSGSASSRTTSTARPSRSCRRLISPASGRAASRSARPWPPRYVRAILPLQFRPDFLLHQVQEVRSVLSAASPGPSNSDPLTRRLNRPLSRADFSTSRTTESHSRCSMRHSSRRENSSRCLMRKRWSSTTSSETASRATSVR